MASAFFNLACRCREDFPAAVVRHQFTNHHTEDWKYLSYGDCPVVFGAHDNETR
jgi:hypothetical protein